MPDGFSEESIAPHPKSPCYLTQGEVFLVCVVFVLCSCRDSGDLCHPFPSVCFVAAFTFEFSGRAWAAMVSKHKGSLGFQDTSGPKKSWQMPSRLMSVRNGYVSSVPKPMCGPGGVADDVTLTSQRGSTNRLSLRRAKDGLQGHLLRVVGSRRRLEMRKRRLGKSDQRKGFADIVDSSTCSPVCFQVQTKGRRSHA